MVAPLFVTIMIFVVVAMITILIRMMAIVMIDKTAFAGLCLW